MTLPPFTVEQQGNLHILRDDLIAGGTKRRALSTILTSQKIFYAGTTMGHGALALAHACKDNGKLAHIFICADNAHPMVLKLRDVNAMVETHSPMPIAELHALTLDKAKGRMVFPPGFDMPDFENALVKTVSDFDASPYSEIWTTSVTGTLTRALKRAFPDKIFKTVSVVKSGDGDFQAREKYHRPAKLPPPYPSCPHTDSKLWQFAKLHAAPGALIWNTAG